MLLQALPLPGNLHFTRGKLGPTKGTHNIISVEFEFQALATSVQSRNFGQGQGISYYLFLCCVVYLLFLKFSNTVMALYQLTPKPLYQGFHSWNPA